MLTSRERVKKTLAHEVPDRVPIDYTATPEAHQKLKSYLKIDDDEVLLQRLGVDFRRVAPAYVGPKEKRGGFGIASVEEDIWGVRRKPVKNQFGEYNEIVYYPLGEIKDVKELDDYPWPEIDWFDCSVIPSQIEKFDNHEQRWILTFGGGAFESPWYMRGLDKFLMDLVLDPELATGIIKRVTGFYIALTERVLDAAGGRIDMVLTGGDIGTQEGMMLAPELWRKHVLPWSTRLIQTYSKLGVKSIYHSCGSIVPVIGDFINAGLDVLDPIQTRAKGMDPKFLKETFGNRLSFHGGVDVQHTLPYGTPEEVRRETENLIQILGKNGGYIMTGSHAIQPDTSPENIMAMYEAALGYRY